MTIHFRAVNFTADAKLKEFSKERIEKLALFHNQILEVFVFTKVENSIDGINKSTIFEFVLRSNKQYSIIDLSDIIPKALIRINNGMIFMPVKKYCR